MDIPNTKIKSLRFEKKDRGSVLLEFGIVAILFLTIFFGIVDFARALYTYHFVGNAAREATRYAIVRGSSCTGPAAFQCNVTPDEIQDYVQSITPGGVNSANVNINKDPNFIWPATGPGTGAGNNGGCNAANGQKSPGCTVQVQVIYPFTFIFPLMPSTSCPIQVNGQSVTANICMTSVSTMVISQ